MAIFPEVQIEATVQVDDKTRIDATRSFVSKDEAAITLVEIDPGDGTYRDVTGTSSKDWYFDWAYGTDAGSPFSVNVRVTTDGAPVISTKTIIVLSEADDALFSTDPQLESVEKEILRWLPKGKNSFKYKHRTAQKRIMDELDANGNTNTDGSRLTKDQMTEVDDINQWSIYLTLSMIYMDISNKPDDTFSEKARAFASDAVFYKERSFIRIDLNKDGTATVGEFVGIRSARIQRY